MSGKFRVAKFNEGRSYENTPYDDLNSAIDAAKKQMGWYTEGDYTFYITQDVARIERPAVDNAIVTTL